jgi:hypothetical protein
VVPPAEDNVAKYTALFVHADEMSPRPDIISPAEGTFFVVGDRLSLVGTAVDFSNNTLPDRAMTWEVQKIHDDQIDVFLDHTIGNHIQLEAAPGPEDFHAAANTFLRVVLTVIDANGRKAAVSRDIHPKKQSLEFQTEPPGLQIVLDNYYLTAPETIASWENHILRVMAPDQPPYFFQKWMDSGMGQNRTIVVSALEDHSTPKYTAVFAHADEMSPRPIILSPAEGSNFFVGEKLSLFGTAVDFQDKSLPETAMVWKVDLIRGYQTQVFLHRTTGNNILLEAAPGPNDFLAATNTFLRVILSVTDAKGRRATVGRDIYPKKQSLTFQTDPPDLQIVLDNYYVTAPETITSWENQLLHVTASDQPPFFFQYWSDGVDSPNRTVLVSSEGGTYTAHFVGPSTETSAGFETKAITFLISLAGVGACLLWPF